VERVPRLVQGAPIAGNPLAGYAAKLKSDGKTQPDIEREMSLIGGMLAERTDWIGIYFDKVYSRPVTGNPAQDGFNAEPSAFLVESIKALKPGAALDAGVGQGRNAVTSPGGAGR
jgi:hypothetical protein